MVAHVVNADIHAVLDLGVLLLGVLRGADDAHLGHLRLAGIGRGDDVAIGIKLDAVGSHLEVRLTGEAMRNSLLGAVQGLDLAALTAKLLQVLEVAIRDGGDVVTAEHTDLEILRLSEAVLLGNLGTCALQIVQGLVDDAIGTNVLGNVHHVATVGNQLGRRCQINTVDVSMAVVNR